MEMSQRTVGRISRWISVICAFVLAMAMGITAWATAEPGTTIYIADGKQGVNIRSQASTNSEAVGKLDGGAALTVVSVVSADGNNWYQVECVINGETKTGYIREDLVVIPESGGEPAETETPEGGGEGVPEDAAPAPEETMPSNSATILDLSVMDSGTAPERLPAGFRSATMELNDIVLPAWTDDSNQYYIFYATAQDGTTGWFLIDSALGKYIRYNNMFGAAEESVSANGSGVSKTAFIIVVVFCVVLVAATAVMGIKLMNGGGSDDYDDYDDDDDYDDEEDEGPRKRRSSVFRKFSGDDDDDYEDEEDDEDDYDDRRRSSARPTHQVAVQQGMRTARPVGENRQPVQNRPASQGRPVSGSSSAGGARQTVNGGRPAGQQGQPSGGMTRTAGQQPTRTSGQAPQGQQRYVQRQAGQQRYAQRTTTTRRNDDEY
ncbi:MAG: SH3 domain-containing protein [Lachnospiraceae bacterium]|nr:SH3 domain-containing protein [Lachnospiraceae bacterium]